MDYLPAIQFAAALNIGYIIPTILEKVYGVLENIDVSYLGILSEVKNKAVLKKDEVCHIHVINTVDNHSTQDAIDQLSSGLEELRIECDEKGDSEKKIIKSFIGCSGYRSLFFYSALFSIFVLILIPFCHQHINVWGFKCFLYLFSVISSIYLIVLFINVIVKKKDISCHKVLWRFITFVVIAAIVAFFNGLIPSVVYISLTMERVLSWMSILVSFLPGATCVLFISGLILYSKVLAKRYANKAEEKLLKLSAGVDKLNEMNKILNGEISLS